MFLGVSCSGISKLSSRIELVYLQKPLYLPDRVELFIPDLRGWPRCGADFSPRTIAVGPEVGQSRRKEWLNWLLGIAFFVTMAIPVLGLLVRKGKSGKIGVRDVKSRFSRIESQNSKITPSLRVQMS